MLLFLVLSPALLWAQGEHVPAPAEEKPKPKTAGEIVIDDPGNPVEDSALVRKELARFQSAFRKAGKDTAARVELLTKLGGWDHPAVYKELSKHVKSKDYLVAVEAVIGCARQSTSKDKAGKLLCKVAAKEKRTNVICAALVGMGKLGYDHKSAYKEAESNFREDLKEKRLAAARYFGYIKAKSAFRMLAELLDEPKPTLPPDDPANPPASYWKERWEEWSHNSPYYRWALSQIVPGETFESTAEARQWAEQQGKEHGIEW
jgi:hypothetical protein